MTTIIAIAAAVAVALAGLAIAWAHQVSYSEAERDKQRRLDRIMWERLLMERLGRDRFHMKQWS